MNLYTGEKINTFLKKCQVLNCNDFSAAFHTAYLKLKLIITANVSSLTKILRANTYFLPFNISLFYWRTHQPVLVYIFSLRFHVKYKLSICLTYLCQMQPVF